MTVKTICPIPFTDPIDPDEDLAEYYEFTADESLEPDEMENIADFMYELREEQRFCNYSEGSQQFALMNGNVFTGRYTWATNVDEAMKIFAEGIADGYGVDLEKLNGFWVANMTACLC